MNTAQSPAGDRVDYPRLGPPVEVDERMLAFLRTTKFYDRGRPLHAHQVLSHHPRAGIALNRWLDWGEDAVLSRRERRMVILRTAALTSCAYEFNVHRQQGVAAGDLTPAEVDELAASAAPDSGTWSQRERALVAIDDAVCRADTLSDEQWLAASSVLPAPDVIECLCVVGYYRMCCALMNALGVPDEGDLTTALAAGSTASDQEDRS